MKPAPPKLKEEMRTPWSRSNDRFIRQWLVLGDLPLAEFETDLLGEHGGEAAIKPVPNMAHKLPGGSTVRWRAVQSWGDAVDVSDGNGLKRDVFAYAFTTVHRQTAGKALLTIGSDEGIRVYVNGAQVLDRRTRRQLSFDEDRVEVDLKAGDNSLLIKLEQRQGAWNFAARVLERGAIPPRVQEIGPSLIEESPTVVLVKTDVNAENAALDKVTVQAVAAGGKIIGEKTAARGESVRFDAAGWPDGPYELRCTTRRRNGLLYATHLPWYKGDAISAARALAAAAAKADLATPGGLITKMLGDMIVDRLGKDFASTGGNPWWAIHSPLMEYEELKLEAAGNRARERAWGFYRLAYIDDVDGSPQFCRIYLPPGYDRAKKWPMVVKLHGYNPANPDYVRWWSADSRHSLADVEYSGRQGIIYVEPHGRGNTTYLGLGDDDIVRVIEMAKKQLSVDEDRVYLSGDSMGGWGTWNVATRHPDLFAAIAPIFGGSDYHAEMPEEQLAALTPLTRFLAEKNSSWSRGEALMHLPVLVHHGDVDRSVNVDYSRYGVRMLQRWGYNVRYVEMPGYQHEDLNAMENIINWFLLHRRVADPPRVRVRSAELQYPSAYWVKVDQAADPREFMVVDAEAAGPNTIRVDSQNVLAMTLSPGPALVDAAKPVKVVWNGEASTLKAEGGRLALRAAGYRPAVLEKNAAVAGPMGDILNTPFAVVYGTASADAAMNDVCRRKAEAFAEFWRQWQRQPPRVFKDSELSDRDAARYSLILVGGPEANLAARRLSDRLPVEVSADKVRIGERSFEAPGARVQAVFPNPLNASRYVLIVASASAAGMHFWRPGSLRNAEFDFAIEDNHVAMGNRISQADVWVAGGWFDSNWRVSDELVIPGNAEARAASVALRAPGPDAGSEYEAFAGKYELAPGTVVEITRDGNRLMGRVNGQEIVELVPASESEFVVMEGPAKIAFEKDASGKVVSAKVSQGGRDFTAKRIE